MVDFALVFCVCRALLASLLVSIARCSTSRKKEEEEAMKQRQVKEEQETWPFVGWS